MRAGNEREAERKGITGSKEKREIKGKGGKLGIMEYVSRFVSVRYWQPYRLAPFKMFPPLWPPHSKKLAPPLVHGASHQQRASTQWCRVGRI